MLSNSTMDNSEEKLRFDSLLGYALTAAKDGEKVQIGFQINCKDIPPETKPKMTTFILDNLAYPEAFIRIKNGKLNPDFRLHNVHILMYADKARNEVLLNDEVRFKAHVKFADGKTFEAGQPVKENDIEDILALYPSDKNDPNAAHIMLTKFKDEWQYACDLIYDRERARKRFETSKSFFKTANYCMQEKLWGPLVDTLFSSTELCIQSILLLHHNPKFSTNQDHEQTRMLFAGHAENGNIDIKFADHYTKLTELRKQGRYLTGVHNNSFRIDESDAKGILDTTSELIEHTEKLLTAIDFSRKPKEGEYVAIGQG